MTWQEHTIINNVIEIDNLNEPAGKVQKPEEVADIIQQYEEILRTKRKVIIFVTYYQGKLFKRFREKEKFTQMASKLKIHKSTLIFNNNVFKLIEKHPKLTKSSVTLNFLKNYFKDTKQICNENSIEFE